MPRNGCLRCRRPTNACLCDAISPVSTHSLFVFLLHPKEDRKNRIGTGRLAHLALASSELHIGIDFDQHPRVAGLLTDETLDCRLLYPGPDGRNLSRGEYRPLPGRRPVFFLVDGTWPCTRTLLRRSASLRGMPRVGFDSTTPSLFAIKRQPRADALSTLEAAHRCVRLLAMHGHERVSPAQAEQLLAPLRRIMEIQMGYPGAPARGGR